MPISKLPNFKEKCILQKCLITLLKCAYLKGYCIIILSECYLFLTSNSGAVLVWALFSFFFSSKHSVKFLYELRKFVLSWIRKPKSLISHEKYIKFYRKYGLMFPISAQYCSWSNLGLLPICLFIKLKSFW